ncbi:hypothetical protein [Pedobacter heparinus]|uniref:Uncharacterized protein n=1 Tax=Pedobacter heparinus (strain ATCC 13125 / DSM 2366 / CIP 104194 / JCM 7457 / NBRC 12017 / NCIMB 9290 / NRRL B-14731 / HIM 762-3) TaxID=485917 RepID=C6Y3L6_PEDHD|nr:hypothetical protein [Pedobacter heparinus]ACU03295.1 hypothetical protein Phep_1077 [Pedobacter heparinus DSM 2366]
MKILKFSLTAIPILLILVGVFAFKPLQTKTTVESKKQEVTSIGRWYIYNGIAYGLTDALNPINYRPLAGGENVNILCNGYQTLCAIYAEPDPMIPGRPLITMTQAVYLALLDYYAYGIQSFSYMKLKNYQ